MKQDLGSSVEVVTADARTTWHVFPKYSLFLEMCIEYLLQCVLGFLQKPSTVLLS